jgi:hypothetical protein
LIAIDAVDGKLLLTTAIDNVASILVSPVIGDINNDQVAEVVVADQQGGITALTINRTLPSGSAAWANNLYQRWATLAPPQ